MAEPGFRIEKDSLGEVAVPEDALYSAQTQRALENFRFSSHRLPGVFISALGLIKASAAAANRDFGSLQPVVAEAIIAAATEVESGQHDSHFPIDVFQTGSATSTNMNANEVIATLAARRLNQPVHPNDHVNLGQSSNDVIPTTIHVSAARTINAVLLPALAELSTACGRRAEDLKDTVKTGRTHLMDAVPMTFGQELSGWQAQIDAGTERIRATLPRIYQLAIGGTAIGTGLNAHPQFGATVAREMAARTGLPFEASPNYFASISSQDAALELSGQLRVIAVSILKIANDLRWMNSGPISGLGEISLPSLQPGSSIMPGKSNPVIPEAVAMACAHVIGNDTSILLAAQAGNFQLNTMLPLIAFKLLESIELLAKAASAMASQVIPVFIVNTERVAANVGQNPIIATSLNPVLGYDHVAKITKEARETGESIRNIAQRRTTIEPETLDALLDPLRMARPRA